MTIRDFLNASYALLVETWTSIEAGKINLLEAVEKVEEKWPKEMQSVPSPEKVKAENENAMAQLQAMLAGVQGAPV